jgi:hypothetical protein
MSTEKTILAVHEEVKKELASNPDVRSVGIGLKEVNGELTNEIAFKVYVNQKKPLSELTPERIIPKEIRGFKTDVVRLAQKTPLTGAGPRPLVGGVAVSSVVQATGLQGHGTLGCIARLKGTPTKVLLCNEHVFTHSQAGVGQPNKIFQPQHSDSLGFICNEVGSTSKGTNNNVNFNNGTFTADFFVDAAIASLNSDIGARNQVFGMGVLNGSRDISGLVVNDANAFKVLKRGVTTALTVGVIEDIALDDPQPGPTRQIVIRPNPGHAYDKTFQVKAADKASIIAAFNGFPVTITDVGGNKLRFQTNAFALQGDSGSVLLDENNAVVGLLHAMFSIEITILKKGKEETEAIPLGKAFGCHIGPVMQEMGIEIQAGSFPSSGVVQPRIEVLRRREPRPDDGDLNRAVRQAEEELRASPNGELVFGILEKHFPELVHLVHHRRPVIVTWNRSKGPGFANSFLRSLRYPQQPFRKEIDGIRLQTFLNRMYDVLIKEGSAEFGDEVARLRGLISRLAEYEKMSQVIDHLKKQPITMPAHSALFTQPRRGAFVSVPRSLSVELGAPITNSKGVPGTLGCFAQAGTQNANILLSSHHVLFGNGAEKNQEISLLKINDDGFAAIAIGKTLAGKLGIVHFEGAEYYVDCATAAIVDRWWTRSAPGSITGFATAQLGSHVKKLGSASGLTEGIIADIHYPDEAYIGRKVFDAPNQILIKPLSSASKFSLPGDSGAVVLDEQNRIVGLLWGSNSSGEGIACHIGPVIQELGLSSMTGKMILLKRSEKSA